MMRPLVSTSVVTKGPLVLAGSSLLVVDCGSVTLCAGLDQARKLQERETQTCH
jgi:hypothetical protein